MTEALIIVDIQYDFLPGGTLAVSEGDEIIPIVNQLMDKFDLVVATQDFHPANHESFAANHEGRNPGEVIDLHGLDQVLWPVHCVQGGRGAALSEDLHIDKIAKVFTKGEHVEVDSYSGFFDNGRKYKTALDEFLKSKGVEKVYVVGLATDYCVKFTALDAKSLGYDTVVISDATRAVNLSPQDGANALLEMKEAGVIISHSADI